MAAHEMPLASHELDHLRILFFVAGHPAAAVNENQ